MGKSVSQVIHNFVVNPEYNGGEAIMISTTKWTDGKHPEDFWYTQKISLQSYSNSASFSIGHYLTPDTLRKLANELEVAQLKAEQS